VAAPLLRKGRGPVEKRSASDQRAFGVGRRDYPVRPCPKQNQHADTTHCLFDGVSICAFGFHLVITCWASCPEELAPVWGWCLDELQGLTAIITAVGAGANSDESKEVVGCVGAGASHDGKHKLHPVQGLHHRQLIKESITTKPKASKEINDKITLESAHLQAKVSQPS